VVGENRIEEGKHTWLHAKTLHFTFSPCKIKKEKKKRKKKNMIKKKNKKLVIGKKRG
jgi:hypothetical protein